MKLLLLAAIYIAFIGLGVPDSLIGSAWPAVYVEFGVPVSYISFVTLTISGCTVLSSIFSDRIIRKIGTGYVTAASTLLTALALIGFSLTRNFGFMILLAIPLGMAVAALFLVGFGNGSIYPNLIYLTPHNFGQAVSQSVMSSRIAAAYIGVMLTPPVFGLIVNLLRLQMFPWFLALLLAAMAVSVLVFVKHLKAAGNYHPEI